LKGRFSAVHSQTELEDNKLELENCLSDRWRNISSAACHLSVRCRNTSPT
jgi:hypothetical protein